MKLGRKPLEYGKLCIHPRRVQLNKNNFVTCHLSFVICHLSFVICHLSFVIGNKLKGRA
ncbi:MAG: hypothetical protein F6K31_37685 [Symploca sp. SIO2G7]|nr:hypothetical protein [Symploca sp. SIO2G7]